MQYAEIYEELMSYIPLAQHMDMQQELSTILSLGDHLGIDSELHYEMKSFNFLFNKEYEEAISYIESLYSQINHAPIGVAINYCFALFLSRQKQKFRDIVDLVLSMDHDEQEDKALDMISAMRYA